MYKNSVFACLLNKVWAIDIGDEPSALEFPHMGKIFEVVNRLFPDQFANLNLHPVYAMNHIMRRRAGDRAMIRNVCLF